MRSVATGVTMLMLGGCAMTPPEPAPPAPTGACDAARAQAFLGRDGDAVAEQARKAAGARSVRVIRPHQAVTMDFRPDRLNVELDAAGKVTGVRCG